jgi:hypothetical protein
MVWLVIIGGKREVAAGKPAGPAPVLDALKTPAALISISVILASIIAITTSGVLILQTPLHSIASAASTAICIFFAIKTRRQTEFYSRMLGQIRGFANFIKTAEKDRIEMLVKETPDYFFNILPYAWTLELTEEWENKFNRFDLRSMLSSVVIAEPLGMRDAEAIEAKRSLRITSFAVRRGRIDLLNSVVFFLILTCLFVWEIFRFRQALIFGSPYPGFTYFQTVIHQFWADRLTEFILFFALQLTGIYLLLASFIWTIRIEGNSLTIHRPFRKKLKMHIGEISGVDIRTDRYVLMRGTKALTKGKPADKNLDELMIRLGIRPN